VSSAILSGLGDTAQAAIAGYIVTPGRGGLSALAREPLAQKANGGDDALSGQSLDRFLADVGEQHGVDQERVARDIVLWAEEQKLRTSWNETSAKGPAFTPVIPGIPDADPFPMSLFSRSARVVIEIGHIKHVRPFTQEVNLQNLRSRVSTIPGIDVKSHYPSVKLSTLSEPAVFESLMRVLNWVVKSIRKANGLA
jgi:hypothetical protein